MIMRTYVQTNTVVFQAIDPNSIFFCGDRTLWYSKDGRVRMLKDLHVTHLENILKMLKADKYIRHTFVKQFYIPIIENMLYKTTPTFRPKTIRDKMFSL